MERRRWFTHGCEAAAAARARRMGDAAAQAAVGKEGETLDEGGAIYRLDA